MENPKLIEDLWYMYPNENSRHRRRYGIFECPYCGKQFRCIIKNINNGNTKSCGCLHDTMFKKMATKHGLSQTKIFSLWSTMIQRCHNNKNRLFINYGERGIIVCDEWKNDFICFYNWAMNNNYKEGLCIDRINVHGNYQPDNCRFVDRFVNSQNTRLINSQNTTGYRGVGKRGDYDRWRATIRFQNKSYHLGQFDTPEEAAKAYNDFVILNNTNHPLNIIP